MKKQRQHLITQLLAENFVSSQEQLISLLNDQGINATQATVSRDLDDLGSVMVRVSGGAMVSQFLSYLVRGTSMRTI